MTKILVLEKPEEKLRRERERLLGELSVYGERLTVLQDTVDEIKEMIEYYDGAIESLERLREKEIEHDDNKDLGLLRALQRSGYKYLTRNRRGDFGAHIYFPYKIGNFWVSLGYFNIGYNINLTQVEWTNNKPAKIANLLETYKNGGEYGERR